MKFENLVEWVGAEPVFETGLLLAGNIDPMEVRKQLSRWTAGGKIYQLRRGLYALAAPYQKVKTHPFLVANRLVAGSYVSLQSALAYYDLIPEYVPVTTSVTTGRPARAQTPVGDYLYRHVQVDWFHSYVSIMLVDNQAAYIATPEKALLDLVYLEPGSDTLAYLQELRLQNLERLDLSKIQQIVQSAHKPKLARAYPIIVQLVEEERSGYETL